MNKYEKEKEKKKEKRRKKWFFEYSLFKWMLVGLGIK